MSCMPSLTRLRASSSCSSVKLDFTAVDQAMVIGEGESCLSAILVLNPEEWTKRSILNTARMGKFSSDRAVHEYAADVWKVQPFL